MAEGWSVIGFDIERHDYGTGGYPGKLVLQDVLTLHGSQFRTADCIVASPPCQGYSYRAMPWKRAKALPPPSNELFDVCFEIQRQACEAAGRYIPLVVENVCGAQKWVGRAKWHYGSFYLWGDVPALMPSTLPVFKGNPDGTNHGQGSWFAVAASKNRGTGQKVPGFRFDGSGRSFQTASVATKGFANRFEDTPMARVGSHSPARKAASAAIAKIPFDLASYIARAYKPNGVAVIKETNEVKA